VECWSQVSMGCCELRGVSTTMAGLVCGVESGSHRENLQCTLSPESFSFTKRESRPREVETLTQVHAAGEGGRDPGDLNRGCQTHPRAHALSCPLSFEGPPKGPGRVGRSWKWEGQVEGSCCEWSLGSRCWFLA
jgi:hypothetical protein